MGDLLSQEAYMRTGKSSTGAMAYEKLHWDGDTLLFTTNNAGALDDIRIGGLADSVIQLCSSAGTNDPIAQPGPDGDGKTPKW